MELVYASLVATGAAVEYRLTMHRTVVDGAIFAETLESLGLGGIHVEAGAGEATSTANPSLRNPGTEDTVLIATRRADGALWELPFIGVPWARKVLTTERRDFIRFWATAETDNVGFNLIFNYIMRLIER